MTRLMTQLQDLDELRDVGPISVIIDCSWPAWLASATLAGSLTLTLRMQLIASRHRSSHRRNMILRRLSHCSS